MRSVDPPELVLVVAPVVVLAVASVVVRHHTREIAVHHKITAICELELSRLIHGEFFKAVAWWCVGGFAENETLLIWNSPKI